MDSDPSAHRISSGAHLDLSTLSPIFLYTTHLDTHDLHDLEDQIIESGGILTYDITEAKIVLSKAERKRRIELDLRGKGLFTQQLVPVSDSGTSQNTKDASLRAVKRRKLSVTTENPGEKEIVIGEDDSTASEAADDARAGPEPAKFNSAPVLGESVEQVILEQCTGNTIRVLKLKWFEDCYKSGKLLPIEAYLSYEGRPVSKPADIRASIGSTSVSASTVHRSSPHTILERAGADAPARDNKSAHGFRAHSGRRSGSRVSAATSAAYAASRGTSTTRHTRLLQQTTSEHESNISSDIPEMPDWVKAGVKYACERDTPPNPPNAEFIEQLKKIRLARLLTNDEIGVRAYSTSIASIAAYPYKISNPREILQLPGCDTKIANLYIDYVNTGKVKPAEDAENDEELKVIRLFYHIWGVGASTAREFYHDRGWRELDDVVEFGWGTLSRVQQIGVKYYSEFLSPIPRKEVDEIAATITRHAIKVRDSAVQALVVGGYRRGKDDCGDVDIIISHPKEKNTLNLVDDIVSSLEEEGWITHTLLLSLTGSNRGQQTLAFKAESGGHGFDTLDKALVVWQDPDWSTKEADVAANPKAKNPNVHRRVDIIISSWRTVGCAVTGWSGGTTFQRDLRRYAKHVKGWKFDSSGVRDRGSGHVVDIEGYGDQTTRAKTMEEAEKRVFGAFGLEYREPWERCTG